MSVHARSISRRSVVLALMGVMWPASVWAQTPSDAIQGYFSNGADFTSVPAPGQPGAEYYYKGAECMKVPAAGQPGAEYFSTGANFTSVPAAGQPGAEYFSTGANFTSAPAPGQPGAEYFSNGANFTSVPAAGQPGAEYFARGADFTSVPGPDQPGAWDWYSAQTSVPMSEPAPPTAPLVVPTEPPSLQEAPQATSVGRAPHNSGQAALPAVPVPPASTESSTSTDGLLGTSFFDAQPTLTVLRPIGAAVVANAEPRAAVTSPVQRPGSRPVAAGGHADHSARYELFHGLALWTLASTTALALSAGCVVLLLTMLVRKMGASRRRVRHP